MKKGNSTEKKGGRRRNREIDREGKKKRHTD
jgi:hypothetical protein